jgi:hypothetical protein
VRLGPGGQGGRAIAGFRLLWHQVELNTGQADPAVAEALRYLVNGAEHHLPALAVMHYSVATMADGSHVVSEEGDALEAVDSADGVLDLVYRRVHQRAFELASLRGWVRLHAAVVDGAGGRTLIVAPSGTGKTTLSCRLLLDGAAVAADESVMIRGGIALPVARRFHLKSDLEAAVPDLRPYTTDLPSLSGGSVRAFDPSEANFPWSVKQARVAHVVLLERGVERSTLAPGSAVAVMPEIVAESFPHQEPTGALLAEIAAVLSRARCWRLRMHSVNRAATLVASLPESRRPSRHDPKEHWIHE